MINKKEFTDLVQSHKNVLIYRHVSPDGDALGSQYSMALFIEAIFKGKKIYIIGDKSSIFNNFFPAPDNLPKNINWSQTLSIIIDTANKERICGDDWQKANKIIKIDHHPNLDPYADFNYVNEQAASICEELAIFYNSFGANVFTKKMMSFLYMGIITDTGRFKHRDVGEKTFYAASLLMKNGLNADNIYSSINDLTLLKQKLNGYITYNIKHKKGLSYFVLNKNIIKKWKLDKEQYTGNSYLIMGPKETEIGVYAYRVENKKSYKVSIRSKRIIISDIARKYNGGGHDLASGCMVESKTQLNKLFKDLRKKIKKNGK